MDTWAQGDLLIVTKRHIVYKGSMAKEWPEVWCPNDDEHRPYPTSTIDKDEIVLAMDSGETGQHLVVRVLFNNSIWVVNTRWLKPIKQTKNILT